MIAFNDADILRSVESATLGRGRRVLAKGLVIDVDVNPAGTTLIGRVRGSEPRPYRQVITIKQGPKGVAIDGSCSCFMGSNCKHVAAVLLDVLETRQAEANRALQHSANASMNGADSGGQQLATLPHVTSQALLSQNLESWLDAIETGNNVNAEDYPVGIKQRLLYVLDFKPARDGVAPRVLLSPIVATLLKGGGFGESGSPYNASNIDGYQPAKHLRPSDFEILRELAHVARRANAPSGYQIALPQDASAIRLLTKAMATGRVRFGSIKGPVLSLGPVRPAILSWTSQPNGRQQLVFAPVAEGSAPLARLDAVLPFTPPHYVDAAAGHVGPIDCGLPDLIAARMATLPDVPLAEAAVFATSLEHRLAGMGLAGRVPLPAAPTRTEIRNVRPTPRLELFLGVMRVKPQFIWYTHDDRHRRPFRLPLARLTLDYGGEIVSVGTKGERIEQLRDDLFVVTPRDHKFEVASAQRLAAAGIRNFAGTPLDPAQDNARDLFLGVDKSPGVHDFLARFDDPARFIAFATQEIPKLAAEGWEIHYSADYPYQIADGTASFWAEIGEGSGIDWMSFEMGVEFEGHRLNLVPHLTELLSAMPPSLARLALSADPRDATAFAEGCDGLVMYHTLPDGRLLPLPASRLAPMLRALLEMIGPRGDRVIDGKVRLHRAEIGAVAAFADDAGANVAWAASSERLMKLGDNLRRGRVIKDITPPVSFKASLRPYQQDGFAWLDFLRESGFGGVLADDMGLGKTVQALAFLAHEKAEGRLDKPALIVAPTSVLPNWQAEAQRFAPELSVLALRGSDRKQFFGDIGKYDLVLTTYPLLARDSEVLLDHEFHAAILDEAQVIKNPKATISALSRRINARHRLALTGTPLENNLGEVWSLFQFLAPGLLGDEATFRRTFRTPIEKHGDQAAQAFLSRRLKPFMLRRTKQEVATELPPKTEIIEHVQLEGSQRDLYETVRVLMHKKVRDEIDKKGLAKSHIIFLDALLKLRQVCCDPRLLKMPQARKVKHSAKLDRLMEMIPEMVGEGRKILLFSQFTSMLALIEAELTTCNIPYVMLTGDTADRATPVRAFQSGAVPLFLLSLKAGGTGLNLTAADTVIHYDPWWNPAVENQATDRAYRIGQDKPVFVYKLIVDEGIETAIEVLKARKAALADALFAGTSKTGLDLTDADISALFAPLDRQPLRKAA